VAAHAEGRPHVTGQRAHVGAGAALDIEVDVDPWLGANDADDVEACHHHAAAGE
jgi:hypothetical protein